MKLGLMTIVLVCTWPCVVSAQHSGDFFVARNQVGQLVREGFDPAGVTIVLLPVSGLIRGWTGTAPGFDRLIDADVVRGLFPLASGARIYLEAVAIDPAFRVIDNDDNFQILDAPGERIFLGDQNVHAHPTWHINSADARFDPDQCVWNVTFVLRDLGTTHYAMSAPFAVRFSNVATRAADGDFDEDGDVDLDDHAALSDCLDGPLVLPEGRPTTSCFLKCLNAFDFDDDEDVDLADTADFQARFGEN